MSNTSPHRLSIRIYYEDTDFSGVVYHASYLRFLERGRTETLRDRGIDQATLYGDGGKGALSFAVRHMVIDWLKPARMDDVVIVETQIGAIKGASLTLHQRILRGEDILMTAEVLVALVTDGKPARMPPSLRAKLQPNESF
ncbi:MAG: tol-pal system-associated acyl-CoA thioesterase [Hyphomicrobiales bacterium]